MRNAATAGGSSGSVRASELLDRQEKKFTLVMPEELHIKLKNLAASNRTTVRELMIEALREYTLPKYK